MTVNIDPEKAIIQVSNGELPGHVHDFKYLGPFILASRKDQNTRKGMAWNACIKLQKVWTSGISDHQEFSILERPK